MGLQRRSVGSLELEAPSVMGLLDRGEESKNICIFHHLQMCPCSTLISSHAPCQKFLLM